MTAIVLVHECEILPSSVEAPQQQGGTGMIVSETVLNDETAIVTETETGTIIEETMTIHIKIVIVSVSLTWMMILVVGETMVSERREWQRGAKRNVRNASAIETESERTESEIVAVSQETATANVISMKAGVLGMTGMDADRNVACVTAVETMGGTEVKEKIEKMRKNRLGWKLMCPRLLAVSWVVKEPMASLTVYRRGRRI